MKRLIYILIIFCFTANVWGATYDVCASGCDGTIANFEAGDSPFDALASDTVTFTDSTQNATLVFPDSFGTQESHRATLVFTGVTITVAGSCLDTNGRDYVTISGGTFSGGNGSTACIEVDANSVGITLDGITVNPNSGNNRLFRIWEGANYFILKNSTINSQTTTQNAFHVYLAGGTALTNVTIDNNTFTGGGGHILHVVPPGDAGTDITDFVISNNTFTDWGDSAGDVVIRIIWKDSTVVSGLTISGNTFTDGQRGLLIEGDHTEASIAAYDIDIDGNSFSDTGSIAAIDINTVTSTAGTSYIRNNIVYRAGGSGGYATINGLRCGVCNGVIIENNEVSYSNSLTTDGNGIIVDKHEIDNVDNQPSVNVIVRNNRVHDNTTIGGRGISVYVSTGTKVYNNISYSNTRGIGAGGNATQASSGTLVYNNTLYGNSDAGLQVRQYGGDVTANNNILVGNNYGVLEESSADTPTIDYNLYDNNTTADVSDEDAGALAKGANAVSSDPKFVNAAGGNFNLAEGSPVIDAGVDLSGTFTDDYLGRTRPYGDAWDIGAYEYADKLISGGANTVSIGSNSIGVP